MVKLIPIGGVREIGMNMFMFRSGKDNICVDAGVIFPNNQYFGIDTIMPDYDDLLSKFGDIPVFFITHGHEDHVGGIPYMLGTYSPKIYAAPYALEVITSRCKNTTGVNPKKHLRHIKFGETISEGPFMVEYIRVDHSIPDSGALFIRSMGVNILYAADFKFGETNTRDFLSRVEHIKNEHGIDLLLSDSTNAFDDEKPVSDEEVYSSLEDCFKRADKKIIVTLFSSNIDRINQIISLSKKHGKDLFISGNNLKIHLGIGRKLGYIEDDEGCIKPESELGKYDKDNCVFLCTGSQAERNSSIVRLSYGYHPQLQIEAGDMIIFSSSKIPGNEKVIMDTINRLSEKGAEIVYPDVENVHSSGHAYSEDLERVIRTASPSFFVPMHGEYMHLTKHVELAVKNGLKPENCFILKGGDEFSFNKDSAGVSANHEIKKLYLDSDSGSLVDKSLIKSRTLLGMHGTISVSVLMDQKMRFLDVVELGSVGIATGSKQSVLTKNIKKEVRDYIKKSKMCRDVETARMDIRTIARREFRKIYNDKPEVIVQLIRI